VEFSRGFAEVLLQQIMHREIRAFRQYGCNNPAVNLHEPQSALRSSGRSPNFWITVASPKLPVARSSVRLKGDRADVARLAGERLRLYDGRVRIEALDGFRGRNPIVGGDEGKGYVIGHFRHQLSPSWADQTSRA
jgi:hypothetical protein